MTVYDLMLPIAATGFANHIMSMLAWMALPHHKQEWQELPVEDEFFNLVEEINVPPGQYLFPHAENPDAMKSEEYQKKNEPGSRDNGALGATSQYAGVDRVDSVLLFSRGVCDRVSRVIGLGAGGGVYESVPVCDDCGTAGSLCGSLSRRILV